MARPADELNDRLREAIGRSLGQTIVRALDDPDIVEVMANPDGSIYVESHTHGMVRLDTRVEPHQVETLLRFIAGTLKATLTAEQPMLQGELPFNGSRVQGLLPPVVPSGCFAMRKRMRHLRTLEQYCQDGILSIEQAEAIRGGVDGYANILISGGTGSGKTTLANAILKEMVDAADRSGRAHERFVILEDTIELQCAAPNTVAMRTAPPTVSMRDLLRATLRLNPRRIIVGEVRGSEALDFLKACNTGHPGGLATLHANSAMLALVRLDHLAQEAGVPSQRYLIANTISLVVHIDGHGRHRKVREVVTVHPDGDGFTLAPVTLN